MTACGGHFAATCFEHTIANTVEATYKGHLYKGTAAYKGTV